MRIGFLGLLHMEVFIQRLEQEYGAQPIVTAPGVTYKAKIFGAKNITKYQGNMVTFNNPAQFPDPQIVSEFYEPMVLVTIITPGTYTRTHTHAYSPMLKYPLTLSHTHRKSRKDSKFVYIKLRDCCEHFIHYLTN